MGNLFKFVGDAAFYVHFSWLAEVCYEAARKRGVKLEWNGK